jgi:hypothetical protein
MQGISAAVVQNIVGQESEAMSANYTHIDEKTKLQALGLLPDISRPVRAGKNYDARRAAKKGAWGAKAAPPNYIFTTAFIFL